MYDRNTNRPRGFGFITFIDEECVENVLKTFNAHYIGGKWVECKKATPKDNSDSDMMQMMPGYP
jgi:RNA recognition motif-containing protein